MGEVFTTMFLQKNFIVQQIKKMNVFQKEVSEEKKIAQTDPVPPVRKDYPYFGYEALQYLLRHYDFETVLDIGCGEGKQCDAFLEADKRVTCIDKGKSIYFEKNKHRISTIIDDFNTHTFEQKFDCVWCCHVLEHQMNVNLFLTKIKGILKTGGVLAITVPPRKKWVTGGHVTIWNAGLLLYNLVLAGFDCHNAHILQYGYNISCVVENKDVDALSQLVSDAGDIQRIRPYLPEGLEIIDTGVDINFNGDISSLNWD